MITTRAMKAENGPLLVTSIRVVVGGALQMLFWHVSPVWQSVLVVHD
jgi:hypothetical protein